MSAEREVDEKYLLNEKAKEYLLRHYGSLEKPLRRKSKSLMANYSYGLCDEFLYVDYRFDEGLRIRDNGKSGSLLSSQNHGGLSTMGMVVNNNTIRRLTPTESEALQTVPKDFTNHVSETQRYKMLGNGWTVDVIAHISSYL